MTPQMKVALVRGAIQGFIQFGGLFFSLYALVGMEAALLAGGLGFFTALGYRGVAEGHYDQTRDAAGAAQKSDVTPNGPVGPVPPQPRAVDPQDPRTW